MMFGWKLITVITMSHKNAYVGRKEHSVHLDYKDSLRVCIFIIDRPYENTYGILHLQYSAVLGANYVNTTDYINTGKLKSLSALIFCQLIKHQWQPEDAYNNKQRG